jgi:hypothetical protein
MIMIERGNTKGKGKDENSNKKQKTPKAQNTGRSNRKHMSSATRSLK